MVTRSDEWPDESVSTETLETVSEQREDDLYETAVEMYRQAKLEEVPPEALLDDFEEFLSVIKNTREQSN